MALVWLGWQFGCPRLRQGRIVSDRLPAQNRYGHAIANCDVAWDRQSVTNQEQLPPSPFRDRAVSYLEVPATDSVQSSKFYRQVFGWVVSGDGEQASFTDGSGHVIGHWRTELEVAGDRGVRPYIYVSNLDQVLNEVAAHGGTVAQPRYPRVTCGSHVFAIRPATSSASGSKSLRLRSPTTKCWRTAHSGTRIRRIWRSGDQSALPSPSDW
jgi:predicted enzyme related to lactoylglutathione lyase